MKASLWSNDLFDRESAPTLEGEFSVLSSALRALWERVLGEAVQDDGRPTFTDFVLEVEGRAPVMIPRHPHDNPELGTLRRARFDEHFIERLARLHETQLDRPFDFEPFLALTPPIPPQAQRLVEIFRGALSITDPLRRTARGWRAGEGVEIDVRSGGPSRFTVTLVGLQFEGQPMRFAIHGEHHDSAGFAWRLESDDSPAAQPLRDALTAGGF